jgi:hypothetical protein
MNEPLTILTERVDDIPLVLAQMERMGIARLLDEHFGVPVVSGQESTLRA